MSFVSEMLDALQEAFEDDDTRTYRIDDKSLRVNNGDKSKPDLMVRGLANDRIKVFECNKSK